VVAEPDEVEREFDEREFDEREDEDRELDERSVVECERVPRRVDSLELTAHPPQSSLNGQTRPTVIHLLRQHRHPLFQQWQQLLRQ
jgi:hypothetical protein